MTSTGVNIAVTRMQNRCVACGQRTTPPDTLIDMQPIYDIETAFNIEIDENEAVEIYDMTLDKALKKIIKMKCVQND